MPRAKKYPDELRQRAIRLVFESGRPIAHVAADLGIHPESLRKWVRQAEADEGKRAEILTSAERDELKELRSENRELRRANEILKAASVFFFLRRSRRQGRDPAVGLRDGPHRP
jgi:transposase